MSLNEKFRKKKGNAEAIIWCLKFFLMAGCLWGGALIGMGMQAEAAESLLQQEYNDHSEENYWEVYQGEQPVLRTHLVAHSPEAEENRLKDELQRKLHFHLASYGNIHDRDELIMRLLKDLPHLTEVLEKELQRLGSEHPVELELTRQEFPLRQYGNQLYPPDEYLSLTATIGEGKGENWWCLLYPSLCFPLATPETSPETSQEAYNGKCEEKTEEAEDPEEGAEECENAHEADSSGEKRRFWLLEWWNSINLSTF